MTVMCTCGFYVQSSKGMQLCVGFFYLLILCTRKVKRCCIILIEIKLIIIHTFLLCLKQFAITSRKRFENMSEITEETDFICF